MGDLLEAQGFSHPMHLCKKVYEISVREIKSYPEDVKDDVLWLGESVLGELAPVVRDGLPCKMEASFGKLPDKFGKGEKDGKHTDL